MVAHRFIGQPAARIEDAALLTGAGRFVNDVPVRAALQAAFVRSPFAHARIKSIDVATARAAAG
jgi:CO/xanthine dehydrogenase Mo-binding subunit